MLAALLAPRLALASEADIAVPDLKTGNFLGMTGHNLLLGGLVVCLLGLAFGGWIYQSLKKLPVHSSMRDISELIYETCKTYLFTQGKFIMILWGFIGLVILVYFGMLKPIGHGGEVWRNVAIILAFSLVGIGGSYFVAWFGIRINTFANSRSAFASLRGIPYPTYAIPLRAGISIGTLLISIELVIMLLILL
ncbi:MAG TPA: sodium/proton-translocating pyrophosphatase, partial [Polyangia bacterium]